MERIALVSPYRSFGKLALEVADEMGLQLEYYESDLEEIKDLLHTLEKDPPDVILSRGGMAAQLKKGTRIPVERVTVGILDILKCCMEAKKYSNHIVITNFETPLFGIEEIEEALGISITQVIFQDQKSLHERIKFLSTETQYCLVVGGPSVKYAEEYGLPTVYLSSHSSTIQEALYGSLELGRLHKLIKKQNSRLRAILDSIYDGVIAVNEKGKVELVNRTAEKIFNLNGREAVGKDIKNVLPSTQLDEVLSDGISQIGMVQQEGKVKIVTNRVPIKIKNQLIGAVATFQEVERMVRTEQKVRQALLADRNFFARFHFGDIVGSSKVLMERKDLARRFSKSDFTVLIYGESGTGKELFSQSIHNASTREEKPFVAVNCGALPPSLLESELFGYEEGAFTGAKRKGRQGLFELAHQGTLFLDEIDSLPIEFQGRLLRVIQEGEFMRIGGERLIPVDVRIIAATNSRPEKLLAEKRIRDDLYYRFNVLYLELPPLRNRKEDILSLAKQFLEKSKTPCLIPKLEELQGLLCSYSWPGNVRELHNVMERLSLYLNDCFGEEMTVEEIFSMIAPQILEENSQRVIGAEKIFYEEMEEQEKEWIEKVIQEEKSIEKAAKKLGMSRSTLWRKRSRFKNES